MPSPHAPVGPLRCGITPCAMGGAARTGNVHHLVLYEPSLGLSYPPGSIERIETAPAAGDNEAAVVAVLVDIPAVPRRRGRRRSRTLEA